MWAGPARRWQYENNQLPGASYSIQGANAIDYLVDELGLAEGDKVGVVYFVGDYGSDALAGAEYAADERGLTVVPQEITPAVTDLSAQASALVQEDVKAVVLGAAPGAARLAGRRPLRPGRRRADHRDEPDLQPRAPEHAGG